MKSIGTKFAVQIALVLVLVMMVFGLVSLNQRKTSETISLQKKQQRILQQLALILGGLIYEANYEQAEHIIHSYLTDPDILAIKMLEYEKLIRYLGKGANNLSDVIDLTQQTPQYANVDTKQQDMVYDKDVIGMVEVVFSRQSVRERIQQLTLSLSGGLVLVIVVESLVVFLLARKNITTPLLRLVQAARRIAEGDIDVHQEKISSQDEIGQVLVAMKHMSEKIHDVLQETEGLTRAIQEGKLDVRGNAENFRGSWQELVVGINAVINAFVAPISMVAEYLDRLARGDIPGPIMEAYKGDFNAIKDHLNLLIDSTRETAQIAEEIATGDLSHTFTPRSTHDVLGHALVNMSAYLNELATAATTIAEGDLQQDIQPKSAHDVLGNAFCTMAQQLRQNFEQIEAQLHTIQREIAERKRTEEALRESEERYRQLFELESDAIFLIDNETGSILEANSAAAALYGYGREELLTKKNTDLSAEPEDTQRVTQTTPLLSDQVVTIPLRFHRKKDKTIFPVEITGRFFIRQGRPVHIAAIRDITDRKQAEEKLRESESMYRMLIEATNSFVFSLDVKGNFSFVNRFWTEKVGYSAEEILGKNGFDLITPESRKEVEELFAEVLKGHFVEGIEFGSKTKDKGFIDVLINLTPICDVSDNVTQILGTGIDITDRRRVEEQIKNQNVLLEQAVRKKEQEMEVLFERLLRQEKLATIGQIAGSIAHELRNPLGAVKNSIFFLKRLSQRQQLDVSNPKVKEHLDLIETELNISEGVIAYLLQMTRMKPIQREQTDLRPLIEDAAERCQLPEQIQLTLDLNPEPFVIWADPSQLRQVFINLLTNAIQAIEGDGNITIRATQLTKDTATRIEIENDGAAIAPGVLGKVFEPLYTTKATGTGLGLSICKQIIENHDGSISLRSEKGQGTTVMIVLPEQE